MSRLIDSFRYRPEVDGLRAVAVLAVVLYHAGFGFHGGYIGVDIFFVISGYLITSLIWKDLETGKFTFAHFWERRARRIVPALVVVALVVLLAGWFILLPSDFASLGRATAAQSLFSANIHYWRDSGYFAGVAEEKPLLHTWSLAVEEQFYLIVPWLFWLVYQKPRLRSRRSLFGLLAVGAFLSFALSVVGVAKFQNAAFYLLPTRAWELMFGSLVAFMPSTSRLGSARGVREGASVIGMSLILAPMGLYSPSTPFPGVAAAVPCLGTALVIWANARKSDEIPTAVGRILALKPVVFIGLISYSLYLWHWPFFAYARYLAIEPLAAQTRIGLVLAGFIAAVLSWRFVETPFRTKQVAGTQKAVYSFAACGLAAVLVSGASTILAKGYPSRFSSAAQAYASAQDDKGTMLELTAADVKKDAVRVIGDPSAQGSPALILWGDSHAMSALPAFDALLKEQRLSGRMITHSSTAPVLGWFQVKQFGLGPDAVAFGDSIVEYASRHKVRNIVLAGMWPGYTHEIGPGYAAFEAALVKTMRRFRQVGCQPWIMLSVPKQPFNVPKALSRAAMTGSDASRLALTREVGAVQDEISVATLRAIEQAGGKILDPKPAFLDPATNRYRMELHGASLYRDEHHLSTVGAKEVLLPFLRSHMSLSESP